MAELRGRICRVTVALPSGSFSDVDPGLNAITVGSGDPSAPGLRVAFKITKTTEKEPNTAEITLTNLAESTRTKMQRKGALVLVEAGYQEIGWLRLFTGSARTIDHVRDGANWHTTIKAGDGERAFRFARCSSSFAAGSTAADVLFALADEIGLPVADAATVRAGLSSRVFRAGYLVTGNAQRAIGRLMSSIGWTWSIQDSALQVLAPGAVAPQVIPLVSPQSGLIGSPEMGTPEKAGAPALVKFKSLLGFVTRPGGLVALRSERYDGQVRVKKVTYTGDTHGGDWYVEIEGVLHGGA